MLVEVVAGYHILNDYTNFSKKILLHYEAGFDNLRIDKDLFSTLNNTIVFDLNDMYHSRNVCLLTKFLKRKNI